MSADLLRERYALGELLQSHAGQASYRAWDLQAEREVIVKSLDLSKMQDWQALEYFDREVQTLATLSHPQIPRLYDHFRTDKYAYLVQEAVNGASLRKTLEAGPLSEDKARQLAQQVLNILSYLQDLNPPVIHRDIKPENILLDSQGQAYLIDFGAVRDAARQHQLSVAGTFGYMAPEQAAGRVEPASDLFALGVTLIECLSGLPPHELPQDRDLRLQFHAQIQVSERFERWLTLLVDPVASQRPANAREALHWLLTDAPSESVGRLTLSFPEAQVTRIEIAKQPTKKTNGQLILHSLRHQSPKFLVYWFALFIGLAMLQNTFTPSMNTKAEFMAYHAKVAPIFTTLFWLGTMVLLGWLGRAEFLALKQAQTEPQTLELRDRYLYYGKQRYELLELHHLSYNASAFFQTVQHTKIYLKFKGQPALQIPAHLSPQEQQLFEHAFEQHAQKHLPTQGLGIIQAAQN